MAESSSPILPPESSQYHHFIPRFLLKNFAVFKKPGLIVPKKSTGKKKKKAPMPSRLNLINLESGKLEQADVAHTFGFVDMYRDFDTSKPDQHDLEKRLSYLERDASEIFAKMKRMYEVGKQEVQLSRAEKNLLRRFLFIMLYRNKSFLGRFDKSTEEYDEDDREPMLEYIKRRGFASPKDVWFSNIRAFLDVNLDCGWAEWLSEINNTAYPPDAEGFFKNMQCSFLAFCTPEQASDEFILTQNAYSIFEGPNDAGAWTDYHIFAPVSPQIMIIARSFLLPDGLKTGEEDRLRSLEQIKSMHINPTAASSCLDDLPIEKARNNYSRVVDGRNIQLLTKLSRDKHVFYFRFFSLGTKHVQKINMIMLEEALGTMAIVFKSSLSLRRALEFYMADESLGFKTILRQPPGKQRTPQLLSSTIGQLLQSRGEEIRVPYLKLLESVAKDLGSTITTKYRVTDPFIAARELGRTPAGEYMMNDLLRVFMMEQMPGMRCENKSTYSKLGGTPSTLAEDLHQASCIIQLVIKSDTMMQGQSEESRRIIHRNRADLIFTLDPKRVWLFVKQLRDLGKRSPLTKKYRSGESASVDGIEDVFANAHHVFKPKALSRTLYKAANIEIFLSTRPDFGLVKKMSSCRDAVTRMQQEIAVVFDKPGSLLDCGIDVVERAAQTVARYAPPEPEITSDRSFYDFLSREQNLELYVRKGMEPMFEGLLEGVLEGSELKELKRAMFQHLYRFDLAGRMQE